MADSSVAITAGSGTPIRVLTGLGSASADQQVVTLADSSGNLLGASGGPVWAQPQNLVVQQAVSANGAVDGVNDVSNYTSLRIHIIGNINAANLEYSNDQSNWTQYQAVGVTSGDWAGQLSNGTYHAPVGGKYVRLNVVSVSGSSTIRMIYNQAAPPQRTIQLGAGSQSIGSLGGTVALGGSNSLAGSVLIGSTTVNSYTVTTTAGTNLGSLKAGSGYVMQITLSNPTASPAYLKWFNKGSGNPTLGTDTPIAIFPIAANSTQVWEFGANGMRMTTGMALAITGAIAGSDTSNAPAGVLAAITFV